MKQRNHYQEQRIAKEQFRNRFFQHLEEICTLTAGTGVYPLIPVRDRVGIFLNRVLPMQVLAQEGDGVPDKVLAAMREYLPQMMKETMVALYPNGPEIPLSTGYSVGLALSLYVQQLTPNEYSNAEAVKAKLEKLVHDDFFMMEVLKKVNEIMEILSMEMSTYTGGLYWLTHKRADFILGKIRLQYVLSIHRHTMLQKTFCVEGKNRSAIPVEWIVQDTGICAVRIAAEILGKPKEQDSYPVFIQFHALQRMHERLDCLSISVTHVNIYLSMNNPAVLPLDERTFLFEYSIFGYKIGYFRAIIVGHSILLQTFLLVTQNGTPEGIKLQELAGITKQDKTFLAMDRLSSFMTTEFTANPALRTLFQEAGCMPLLEAYAFLQQLVHKSAQPTTVQMMVQYLGLDTQPDFLETLSTEQSQPTEPAP